MTTRAEDEPLFTVMANSGERPANLSKAYLVESKNANQQYGDGVRDAHEPRTTVITDHKPSHQPKVLLVNSAFPGSNGKKHYHGDEPSFTADTTSLGRMKALLVDDKNNEILGIDSATPASSVRIGNGAGNVKALLVVGGNQSAPVDANTPAQTIANTGRVGNIPRATTPTGRVVRMTPRCLARFQTVPDSYVLPEKKALACKIIGNGIPCLMMQRIMESF